MEISSLWSSLGSASLDDLLVWAVALTAGVVSLIALVNALDMFLDADVPTQ
ncbi:hypothetical protein [Variovorax sp. PAMC 28711]|uniref:hypothetical protein n=1 Tax=Variovorax sp. PAMC 28711 TaxID=1795631 RepID=UPI000A682667|nr:hypothetical protein [Variovorax sp. PAMC 28711]